MFNDIINKIANRYLSAQNISYYFSFDFLIESPLFMDSNEVIDAVNKCLEESLKKRLIKDIKYMQKLESKRKIYEDRVKLD